MENLKQIDKLLIYIYIWCVLPSMFRVQLVPEETLVPLENQDPLWVIPPDNWVHALWSNRKVSQCSLPFSGPSSSCGFSPSTAGIQKENLQHGGWCCLRGGGGQGGIRWERGWVDAGGPGWTQWMDKWGPRNGGSVRISLFHESRSGRVAEPSRDVPQPGPHL